MSHSISAADRNKPYNYHGFNLSMIKCILSGIVNYIDCPVHVLLHVVINNTYSGLACVADKLNPGIDYTGV